jgi:hypothetical protein
MKTCNQCNKEFELTEFNVNCSKTGKLRPYCKYCDRARARKDYRDNREHKLSLQKQWQKNTGYKAPGSYKHNAIKGVYMMVNLKTGERYIGSSKNVYRRRSSWVVKNSHLDIDMSKCIWGVVEECDNYREREQYYISVYQPELNNHGKKQVK